MKKLNIVLSATAGLFGLAVADQAAAAPSCGASTGAAATGKPIIVGGIHGTAAPCDFSASTDEAAANFFPASMLMVVSMDAPLNTASKTTNGLRN